MQVSPGQTETSSAPGDQTNDSVPPGVEAEVQQHRIYVWSSPSPYAVVVEESRSFMRHV